MSWLTTSEEHCNACGKTTLHMNGFCQEKHSDEDIPLISGRHINMAIKNLGKVYRVQTNQPEKYPEIGCVEVTNAIQLLSTAYAEIEHLKKK